MVLPLEDVCFQMVFFQIILIIHLKTLFIVYEGSSKLCSILPVKITVSYLDTKRESVCFAHSNCFHSNEWAKAVDENFSLTHFLSTHKLNI
jgi:hypothetical protein